MPSPLAHGAVAFALWPLLRNRTRSKSKWQHQVLAGMLMLGLLGPDLDIAAGYFYGDGAFALHGGASHSLLAGALFGVVFALVCHRLTSVQWASVWMIGTGAWWSHVLLDAFTTGRGVAMFWPITSERISFPMTMFYGVRHSEPLAWQHHLVTLVTEVPFVLLMWFVGVFVARRIARGDATLPCAAATCEGRHA